jgi:nucleotide-binding universal stress UspA family protein
MPSLASQTQVLLRKILFATDFSSCSETALGYCLGLSRRFDATLYTVSVVDAELDAQPPHQQYLEHSAESTLAKLANSDLFRGINHVELVKEGFGSVSEVLLELIDRLSVDLIVLGTHGRGGIKKLVLGSVAEEILNRAPCSVLSVGPRVRAKSEPEWKFRRILCATDLRPGSESLPAYALWLAKQEHSHLILLHVLHVSTDAPPGQAQRETDIAVRQLFQLLPPETSTSAGTQCLVEVGAVGELIAKVANDQSADLILIGRRRTLHPRVSAHLPWTTLHQVLCRAQCPVLMV